METADGYMVSPADIPAAQRAAGHGRPAGTRPDKREAGRGRDGQPYAATVTDADTDAATSALSNQAARQQLEAIREEWLAPLVAQISEQAETIGRLTERSEHQQQTIAKLEGSRERLESRLRELESPPDPQPEIGSETQQEAVQRPWWRFWLL
ncbi:MAG: hypothetical protein H0V47_05030 [Chloroflexia bacterium]|nr:hypothetical protein [Chloroflexia bacterium]